MRVILKDYLFKGKKSIYDHALLGFMPISDGIDKHCVGDIPSYSTMSTNIYSCKSAFYPSASLGLLD
jgi:hypothetical protein